MTGVSSAGFRTICRGKRRGGWRRGGEGGGGEMAGEAEAVRRGELCRLKDHLQGKREEIVEGV